MTSLNVIHVKYDSCCTQRKRAILILNILDFRDKQYLVTKRLSFVSSEFNTENEDGTDSFFLSFQPSTKSATYLRVLHNPLHCFHLALQHTFNLSPLLFWNKQSWNSLKISYCAFEINSLR